MNITVWNSQLTPIKSQTTYLFSVTTHSPRSLRLTFLLIRNTFGCLSTDRNFHASSEPSVCLELPLLPFHSGKPSPDLCSYKPTTGFMQHGNENSKMEKCNLPLFKGESYWTPISLTPIRLGNRGNTTDMVQGMWPDVRLGAYTLQLAIGPIGPTSLRALQSGSTSPCSTLGLAKEFLR